MNYIDKIISYFEQELIPISYSLNSQILLDQCEKEQKIRVIASSWEETIGHIDISSDRITYNGIIKPGTIGEIAYSFDSAEISKIRDSLINPIDFSDLSQPINLDSKKLHESLINIKEGIDIGNYMNLYIDNFLEKYSKKTNYNPSGFKIVSNTYIKDCIISHEGEYRFVLLHKGIPVAIASFDICDDIIDIKQIQGTSKQIRKINGASSDFLNIKWTNAMVDIITDFAESHGLSQVYIIPGDIHPSNKHSSPEEMERYRNNYDNTAKNCGFYFDNTALRYAKK